MTDSLPLPSAASPEMYLQFARSDLRRTYRRNRVNAFSNAKRALHLQIDVLTDAFGLKALPEKERRSFPQRLDFLSRCGVVAPKILKRLNRLRNMVQHDYYIPERQETEDFLDVVELFLASSQAIRTSFPYQTHFGWRHRTRSPNRLPVSFGIQIRPGTGEIRFALAEAGESDRRASLKIIASSLRGQADTPWSTARVMCVADGKLYYDWISLIVSRNKP